ncbi:MAG: hypothetical protein J0H19_05685 [Rhodospirillales bacterium]|nr:hypothetical protein [Rhodospirillales bacterium]
MPDQLISPGRLTRCARCGHQWVAVPVGSDLPPPVPLDPNPPDEPEGAAADDPPPPRPRSAAAPRVPPLQPRPSGGTGLRLAWAASVALLLGLVVAGILGRHAVMTAWPPSARLYTALGLAGDVPPVPPGPGTERQAESRTPARTAPDAGAGSGPRPAGDASSAGTHGAAAPAPAGH